MKYGIDLIWRKTIEVEANNEKEALEIAKQQFPNHKADFICNEDTGESNSVSICDGCGKQLLDNEIASHDPEQGNDYCKGCTGAIDDDSLLTPPQP